MAEFVLSERRGAVGIITLNRPQVLNAWNAAMREELTATLAIMEEDAEARAVILTGAGDRAFGAGQDLNETKTFDPDRAEVWMGEWEQLYDRIRSLSKPIIAALNGVAAGSAFQVALLCDIRVGHPGVTMGQPEINSGVASTTGPWIMREHVGLARTIDLTLTGRMMDADECHRIGVINRLVPQDKVMSESLALAELLASKPPVAMRLDRQRFREMTEEGFRDCLAAGIRIQREAYASGEPARMMEEFLARKAAAKEI
ncbi:enoyl-CoA hydratase/isomerase family protein [Microvirga tunisiensis]|uniref:Enoyl-CoA hydratase/isomerase family protein n=1 Tax=Microvirga tunisiensis TaxID=2108360 RepID=A0A5N7M9Y0_9HYPH|nr:enoyl-CoA hydratase/isomerase family protein [Microvirga tunisiensis]MPR05501.1 enoyl-CoA hydratase/isomerase family protein [Microvirga tunisiensis]MPR23702.1 enoyl-CoA hydratase/isomerase family protein [Microvirga tunisiensis]